ncbi:oxidoreductase [Enemella dayhoffiae]|uniref:Oxidoreductase n=1 Tax=Enemella dayhoffiae TaxID=2016507 RepID=A0A255GZ61_9ACTN|nr:2Fe-2S iron-sulfur cluster-binding protein [Enemella dayhoffiae]OYO20975.1 oxidoreductase [Enemella dayhoffiae]
MTFTVSVAQRDSAAECREDQSLLDSLLRAGVWVPNSCNQGTCSTCKVRVLSGSVDHHGSSEGVLPAQEREEGYALACQATPCSDVELAASNEGSQAVHHPLVDLTATVTGIADVALDTRRIMLTPEEPLEFGAGQSVSLWVPGHEDVHRQYSIASVPGDRELELHIRRDPGGLASDLWAFGSIELGQEVRLSGPLGDFVFDGEEADGPLLLLGGGTGIAPLKAIALAALADRPDREVHVYHGVRTVAHLYDLDFWHGLAERHPGVRFTPAVSREVHQGARGYVTERLLEDLSSCRGMTGYLCGSDAFVDGVGQAVRRRRLAPRRTFRERFTPVHEAAVAS